MISGVGVSRYQRGLRAGRREMAPVDDRVNPPPPRRQPTSSGARNETARPHPRAYPTPPIRNQPTNATSTPNRNKPTATAPSHSPSTNTTPVRNTAPTTTRPRPLMEVLVPKPAVPTTGGDGGAAGTSGQSGAFQKRKRPSQLRKDRLKWKAFSQRKKEAKARNSQQWRLEKIEEEASPMDVDEVLTRPPTSLPEVDDEMFHTAPSSPNPTSQTPETSDQQTPAPGPSETNNPPRNPPPFKEDGTE
ncbi:rho GTPase-activating protein 17-like [Adelges cooleyi]|uniref:rho GTPase-activating protein 17-like n=1 Tax=Adelges cooleyi TaxID=133065 RepID=UPI00217F3D74|nr:rho GTPase-activating protein 17-like [Adelges cooleyi]